MKFSPNDRMLQLGVVPAVTAIIKRAYPDASASLWQREAKRAHRRIVDGCVCAPGEGPCARQGHTVLSLAALLVGFHASAPEGIDVSLATFDEMVDAALCTPIVQMAFAGAKARPFSEEGIRELASLLGGPGSSTEPGVWWGSLRIEAGTADTGGQALVCTVKRCGLMGMCVHEKRFFLLSHLCRIEEALAASNGLVLTCGPCIAHGESSCELRCTET